MWRPFDFLRALRRLCDEHGIVMIADEVQGGMARTGKMFSIEHSGVVPDLITDGQGIGRRLPALGSDRPRHHHGCGASRRPRRHLRRQSDQHRGGACRAGCDRIRGTVRSERRLSGTKCARRLQALAKELPCIGDVRGLGAMVAFELVKDPKTKEPDAELTAAILAHAETARLDSSVLRHGGERGAPARAAHHSRCRARARGWISLGRGRCARRARGVESARAVA